MKLFIGLISSLLFLDLAVAAGDGIPVSTIIAQVINFGAAICLLVFFTRKAVSGFFANRAEEFHAEAKKAEEAVHKAEKVKREISERLSKLKSKAEDNVKEAHAEAEQLKQKIIHDAKAISEKLELDAKRQSNFEKQRANLELRADLLKRAVEFANERMKDEVDGADLARLRGEFVEKIQVVQ